MRAIRWIDTAIVRDGYLYCMPGQGRMICKIALESFTIEKMIEVSKHNSRFWKLFAYDDEFFCISKAGSSMLRWNETTGEVSELKFTGKMTECAEIIDYKNNIWMFPRELPEDLYYYSIKEKKYYKSENWRKFIRKNGIAGRVKGWHQKDNTVFLLVWGEKRILKFDMDTEQLTNFALPVDGYVRDLVVQEKKFYFLLDNDMVIHCWNPQTESVFDIEEPIQASCYKMINAGDTIIIYTGNNNCVELLCNGKISKTDIVIEKEKPSSAFLQAIRYKSSWIVMPWGYDAFITFGEDFTSYRIDRVLVPMKNFIDTEAILYEGKISLQEWLQYLTEKSA